MGVEQVLQELLLVMLLELLLVMLLELQCPEELHLDSESKWVVPLVVLPVLPPVPQQLLVSSNSTCSTARTSTSSTTNSSSSEPYTIEYSVFNSLIQTISSILILNLL